MHIHNQIQGKPHSLGPQIANSPYNVNMMYPHIFNRSYGIDSSTNGYNEEMKKFIDAAKMYPYYFMNPQVGSTISPSLNPNITSSTLNPAVSSQFGMSMSMHMHNPYMGYPGTASIPVSAYGQIKNATRTLPESGIPYAMSPYSPTGNGPIYHPQYMGSYPSALLPGYGQSPPLSFSHAMGLDKS